jgi:hypothetical protein
MKQPDDRVCIFSLWADDVDGNNFGIRVAEDLEAIQAPLFAICTYAAILL